MRAQNIFKTFLDRERTKRNTTLFFQSRKKKQEKEEVEN